VVGVFLSLLRGFLKLVDVYSTLTSPLDRDVSRVCRDLQRPRRLSSKEGRGAGDVGLAVLLLLVRGCVWRQRQNRDLKGSKHLHMRGLRISLRQHQVFVVCGQALEGEDQTEVLSRIGHHEASPCQGEVALGMVPVVTTLMFYRGVVCMYVCKNLT